jgi:FlaA1/EpsC-like NDP-sugar epimerase
VFMLDMGEPVRIIDLANRMISLAGYRPGVDVRIEVTGLRPGEKLAEELNTEDEDPQPTAHPKILRLRPPLPDAGLVETTVERLRDIVTQRDDEAAKELLFEFARQDGTTIIRLPEAAPGVTAPMTTGT